MLSITSLVLTRITWVLAKVPHVPDLVFGGSLLSDQTRS